MTAAGISSARLEALATDPSWWLSPVATKQAQEVFRAVIAARELAAKCRSDAAGWMALLSPPGAPSNPGDDILRERIKQINSCADALTAILGGPDAG